MHAFWEIIASNSLVVVVLAAGVALLGRIWRNPAGLHLLWLLVLLKLVTPPLVTFRFPLPLADERLALEEQEATQDFADGANLKDVGERAAIASAGQDQRILETAPTAPQLAAAPPVPGPRAMPWLTFLARAWIGGIALFASARAYHLLRFRRLLRTADTASSTLVRMAERVGKRLGLKRVPDILMLPVRLSPLVWSMGGRARVLLPAALFERLDADAREAILAHELAHVRRKDHWIRLLELAITTLFWWHPVAWWACRQIRELEEQCCDGLVLDAVAHDARAYATALMDTLDFLSERPVATPLAATGADSARSLARRIKMLKNYSPVTRLTAGRMVLLFAMGAVPMAVAFAADAPHADDRFHCEGQESAEPLADAIGPQPAQSAVSPSSEREARKDDALRGPADRAKRETERAVAGGLNWLARHQLPAGNWSLQYNGACRGAGCGGESRIQSDPGAAALALLAFLGAGQTHKDRGPYRQHVQKGIAWLIEHQSPRGDLAGGSPQAMYAHGLAAIALCQAYGMTKDAKIGESAAKAIGFIEEAQNPSTGGWRYQPGSRDSDTSVTGCQVMALKSAQIAGLAVKAKSLEGARRWLASCAQGRHHGLYVYQPYREVSPTMTAVGMLCQQYMGIAPNDPSMIEGKQYLLENLPDENLQRDVYYWYYATLVMHNFIGPEWDRWNRQMRRILVKTQCKGGCAEGSWDPERPTLDRWAQGGRLFETALSTLTLEVYYRYLPLFKVNTVTAKPLPADNRSRSDDKGSSQQPAVQRRTVNKLVKDFPEKVDLSTPESATAAMHRAVANPDPKASLDLTVWKYTPRDVADIKRKMESQKDEFAKAADAYGNAEIIEVLTYRDGLAQVISRLHSSYTGSKTYSDGILMPVGGDWKCSGGNGFASLEEARKHFERFKDRFWADYLKVLDGIAKGKPLRLEAGDLSSSRPKRSAPIAPGQPLGISVEKADLMGRVEWAMMHGGRDISARKTIEWGDVEKDADGNRKIRYKFYATIWDKDVYIVNRVFTFDAKGNILDVEDVEGFPQMKVEKPVNVNTQEGMKQLVEDFFSKNFRDITSRESIEWGEVTKAPNGNSSIRYKYRAKIWDKDTKIMNQVFTFNSRGEFVSVADVLPAGVKQ